jgi:hypothetical protein
MADIAKVKRNIERMLAQGAPQNEIDAYVAGEGVSLAELQGSAGGMSPLDYVDDAAKSYGSGVVRGLTEIAGLGGNLAKGGNVVADKMAEAGLPMEQYRQEALSVMPEWLRRHHESRPTIVGSAEINAAIDRATGLPVTSYDPRSTVGEYFRTAGEMTPNVIMPGSAAQRIVAGVVAPAIGAETAGQMTKGTSAEPWARAAGGFAGGIAGGVGTAVYGRSGSNIPGMSAGASRMLEKTVTPHAEQRLAQLGDDAFLFEGSDPLSTVMQGAATRPGPGQGVLLDAVKGRQAGANQRLTRELDDTLGPAVSPTMVEANLEAQRAALHPVYRDVLDAASNDVVDLRPVYDQLRMAIPHEAGPTQAALSRVLDWIAPQMANGQRSVRTNPREVLNVRQALDDEIQRLGETPKAQRAVNEYRGLVDRALAEAVPDIKHVDSTFSNLMGQSEHLKRGSRLLQTGPEAIRPEDLIAERRGMTGISPGLPAPQREAQRIGLRAEIDRLVGTKSNDVQALKQLVQSEGDWNRVKLAEVFGGQEADRILRAVDREAAFQESYRRLVENSMTAYRREGARALEAEVGKEGGKSLRDVTALGAPLSALQWVRDKAKEALRPGRQASLDEELARAGTRTGLSRDQLLRAIREAQRKRRTGSTTTREVLVRALLGGTTALQGE